MKRVIPYIIAVLVINTAFQIWQASRYFSIDDYPGGWIMAVGAALSFVAVLLWIRNLRHL